MFFSFDGIDGTGKSTQLELFADSLRRGGHRVLTCRDPGGTELGERLREILLHRDEIPLSGRAEMLLYMASRAQLVEQAIRPALSEGMIVISDRFLLANVVYQGYAGGMDVDDLWRVGVVAVGGVQPDVTVVLDMPVEAAMRRICRQPDRMESRGVEFMERVRQGFLTEAARRADVVVVDADQDVASVQAEIQAIVESRWSGAPVADAHEEQTV